MKTIKMKMMELISKVAMQESRKSANTSCVTFSYQPQLPDVVKKLRKF